MRKPPPVPAEARPPAPPPITPGGTEKTIGDLEKLDLVLREVQEAALRGVSLEELRRCLAGQISRAVEEGEAERVLLDADALGLYVAGHITATAFCRAAARFAKGRRAQEAVEDA